MTTRHQRIQDIAEEIAEEAHALVERDENSDPSGWWVEFGQEYLIAAAERVLDRRLPNSGSQR